MKKTTTHNVHERSIPVPPELVNLPKIEAEPWLQLSPSTDVMLEGPAFDTKGNLFVTAPSKGLVYKIMPNKQLSTIFNDQKVIVDGSAFHKDGRLFIVCLSGELLIINPDTNPLRV